MNIEPIVAATSAIEAQVPVRSELRAPIDFGELVGGPLDALNTSLQRADASALAFALGDGVPVHEMMLNIEQARLAMQLAVEVRNRAVESYQELMRMQL